MAGWTTQDGKSWQWGEDATHTLKLSRGKLIETHGSVVHTYKAPATIDETDPLADAEWIKTETT